MRYLFLLVCVSSGYYANAQKNVHYTGNVEGGLLTGSKGASTFLFTTHGVQYNRYTFGVGSGIDFYGFSSVPLFADVKRMFSDKNTQPFIRVDAGLNIINSHSQSAEEQYKYAAGSFDNKNCLKKKRLLIRLINCGKALFITFNRIILNFSYSKLS